MRKKINPNSIGFYKHAIIIISLLFASFAFNLFGVGSGSWFTNYQKDSDAVVINVIACAKENVYQGWMTGLANGNYDQRNPSCDPTLEPYMSQVGIQGGIQYFSFRYLADPLGVSLSSYILFARLFTAFLSAITLGAFCLWVMKKFGRIEAYTVALFIANSIWIVAFAKSFYWVLPVLFLPFIITLLALPKVNNKRSMLLLCIVLFTVLLFKFSAGYEYVTALTISMLAALGYHSVVENYSFKKILKIGSALFVTGVVAFAATITLHLVRLESSLGSYDKAKDVIMDRVSDRTASGGSFRKNVYGGIDATIPEQQRILNYYLSLEEYSRVVPVAKTEVLSVFNYSQLQVLSSPVSLKPLFEAYLLSFISALALFYFIAYRQYKTKISNGPEKGLVLAGAIGLLGVASWFVLAHGHSYVHAHINGILFYIPFCLMLYTLVAIKIKPYLVRIYNTFRK